jgi:hypothetical protein
MTVPKATSQNDDDQIAAQTPTGVANKELEPQEARAAEGKLMAEIKSTQDRVDQQALAELQEQVDAAIAHPEPELPPDLVDTGVIRPEKEAEKVISDGTTLNLPIDEDEYRKGTKTNVSGTVSNKSVIGVSSLVALAMWIGRLIKIAHKKTMRVVFRKKEG